MFVFLGTSVKLFFLKLGDSTGIPTEDDVVKDAMYIYEYFHQISPKTSIYVWGHRYWTKSFS